MKRFVIFIALGPGIGLLGLMLPIVLAGAKLPDARTITGGMTMSYIVGVLPAFITAATDMFSARYLTPLYRALASGVIGSAATASMLVWLFGDIGVYGLFAFVPAAACSWLSGEKQGG
jgi:hypothetical protein